MSTSASDLIQLVTESTESGYLWIPPVRHMPGEVTWVDEAGFKLRAFIAGETPEYVHAELTEEDRPDLVMLFISSTILAMTVQVLGEAGRWRSSGVQAYPRSNVSALRIESGQNLGSELGGSWPARAQVVVTISGIGDVKLPAPRATSATLRSLAELLPSLVEDLSA